MGSSKTNLHRRICSRSARHLESPPLLISLMGHHGSLAKSISQGLLLQTTVRQCLKAADRYPWVPSGHRSRRRSVPYRPTWILPHRTNGLTNDLAIKRLTLDPDYNTSLIYLHQKIRLHLYCPHHLFSSPTLHANVHCYLFDTRAPKQAQPC